MLVRRYLLPAACAALAITGCSQSPPPATLDTIDWAARQPVYPADRGAGDDKRAAEAAINAATREALQIKASPDFDGVIFSSVLDYVEEVAGVDIVANWPALEITGVDQRTPITMDLADAPAQRILQIALDQASAEAFDDDKAGYEVIDGIVQVTTIADLRTFTETRLYDVRDLIYDNPVLSASVYDGHPQALQILQLLEQGDHLTQVPEFDLNDALS